MLNYATWFAKSYHVTLPQLIKLLLFLPLSKIQFWPLPSFPPNQLNFPLPLFSPFAPTPSFALCGIDFFQNHANNTPFGSATKLTPPVKNVEAKKRFSGFSAFLNIRRLLEVSVNYLALMIVEAYSMHLICLNFRALHPSLIGQFQRWIKFLPRNFFRIGSRPANNVVAPFSTEVEKTKKF